MPRRSDRRWATRCLNGTRDIENGARPMPHRIDRRRWASGPVDETRELESPE